MRSCGRADLAGETDVGRCADTAEREGLGKFRRRQRLDALLDADPACRAAGPPAADRSVRDAVGAADLEQRRADRRRDHGAAEILDADLRAVVAQEVADREDGGDDQQDTGEADADPVAVGGKGGAVGVVRPSRQGLDAVQHRRILDELRDGAARDHEAGQRRQRQHDGDEQKHRLRGAIGTAQTQPEVDAHAAVDPHQQQQRALEDGARRPQARELVEVVVLDVEEVVGDARVDDVRKEQERDQDAEAELDHFPGRQAQRGARRDLVERERDVDDEGGGEDDGADDRAGDEQAPALQLVHRFDMHQPDRVVEEVRCRECE